MAHRIDNARSVDSILVIVMLFMQPLRSVHIAYCNLINEAVLHLLWSPPTDSPFPPPSLLCSYYIPLDHKRHETAWWLTLRDCGCETSAERFDINLSHNQSVGNKATLWKLEQDKQELVAIRYKRMEGVLLRSRGRGIAEGEKITKYFYGVEKGNYISKQMTKLTLNNREEIFIWKQEHY